MSASSAKLLKTNRKYNGPELAFCLSIRLTNITRKTIRPCLYIEFHAIIDVNRIVMFGPVRAVLLTVCASQACSQMDGEGLDLPLIKMFKFPTQKLDSILT